MKTADPGAHNGSFCAAQIGYYSLLLKKDLFVFVMKLLKKKSLNFEIIITKCRKPEENPQMGPDAVLGNRCSILMSNTSIQSYLTLI